MYTVYTVSNLHWWFIADFSESIVCVQIYKGVRKPVNNNTWLTLQTLTSKLKTSFVAPHIFPVEAVGLEEFVQVSIKFNFCDDVLYSHDRSV